MPLTVLLGGARSGKSATAQSMAEQSQRPVTYVATATAGDDEMKERIARHRNDRPPAWTTLEEPIELAEVLAAIDTEATVIVDCLTLWLSNIMETSGDEPTILDEATRAASNAAGRTGETIAVTNEVGLGLVPPNPIGRRFRDLAGRVNRIWVQQSTRSGLVVAGRILPLEHHTNWEGRADDRCS